MQVGLDASGGIISFAGNPGVYQPLELARTRCLSSWWQHESVDGVQADALLLQTWDTAEEMLANLLE